MTDRIIRLRVAAVIGCLLLALALLGAGMTAYAVDDPTPATETPTSTDTTGPTGPSSPTGTATSASPDDSATSSPSSSSSGSSGSHGPTDDPTQTESSTSTDSSAGAPTGSADQTPTSSATSNSASQSPSASESDSSGHGVTRRLRPSVATSEVEPISWGIAAAVLVLAGALILAIRRPARGLPAGPATVAGIEETFDALSAAGATMIDAGYPVGTVEDTLMEIARVNGHPSTQVAVFPTALLVSTRDEATLRTGVVASGTTSLRLHQIDALDRVLDDARLGLITPTQITERVARLKVEESPYPPILRTLAYVGVCASLAVLLGASWTGVAVAGGLGLVVGAVRLLVADAPPQYNSLVTVMLAFGTAVAVLLLARAGWDTGILPSLIAPLVVLMPGALLTTAAIELASGDLMSGAGRLAAGVMQLVLIASGFLAGAMLVGVPEIELTAANHPVGPLGPWIAVALYGASIVVNQSGRPRSVGWIVLVLYVAYGAQVIGSIFLGGVMSGMVGAVAMTPVAYLIARHRNAPAAMVSFLPGFWLLVPGALGLVGVTTILGGDQAGLNVLVTTTATMVAIALGILAGTALSPGPRRVRDAVPPTTGHLTR